MSELFPGGMAQWLRKLMERRRKAVPTQGYESLEQYVRERDMAASDLIRESIAKRVIGTRRQRADMDYDELRWMG